MVKLNCVQAVLWTLAIMVIFDFFYSVVEVVVWGIQEIRIELKKIKRKEK